MRSQGLSLSLSCTQPRLPSCHSSRRHSYRRAFNLLFLSSAANMENQLTSPVAGHHRRRRRQRQACNSKKSCGGTGISNKQAQGLGDGERRGITGFAKLIIGIPSLLPFHARLFKKSDREKLMHKLPATNPILHLCTPCWVCSLSPRSPFASNRQS